MDKDCVLVPRAKMEELDKLLIPAQQALAELETLLPQILEVLRPYAELWAGLRQMTWEEAHVIDGRAHDLYLKLGGKLEGSHD